MGNLMFVEQALAMPVLPAEAGSDLTTKITNACADVYGTIKGFITALACVCIAVCLVGMLVSKNQRTVEEFRTWRNRIIVSWAVFMLLGTLVTFGKDIVGSGSDSPWK